MKVFTVYDVAVGNYLQPFFMRSKGEAIRAFTELVNDKTHAFSKHASDYVLFEIGSFDLITGLITSHSSPLSLGVATEFLKYQPLE